MKKSHLWVYLIVILLLTLMIGATIFFLIKSDTEEVNSQIEQQELQNENNQTEKSKKNILVPLDRVEVNMPEKMGQYEILGEIEIPKINVKKYILGETTDESLNLSLTKFWGPNLNETGNFSIIGHNYNNLFKRLKELEIGDTFTLTARNGEKGTYEVYKSYIIEPDDMDCIEDSLIGQREVTLITCTVGGAQRLIVKAQQKN